MAVKSLYWLALYLCVSRALALCRSGERSCPIAFDFSHLTCVPRDDVRNCGGCASEIGSGRDCTLLSAIAVGCSRNGKCLACDWNSDGTRLGSADDALHCVERDPGPIDHSFVTPDQVEHPRQRGFAQALPAAFEDVAEEGDKASNRAEAEHEKLPELREPLAVTADDEQPPPLPVRPRPGVSYDDLPPIGAPLQPEEPQNHVRELPIRLTEPQGEQPAGIIKQEPSDPLVDDSTGVEEDSAELMLVPRWLRRQLRGRRFDTARDLLAWLRTAEAPPTPKDVSDMSILQGIAGLDGTNAGPLHQRTNAERFALDLPPLPPAVLDIVHRKETQEQREKRLEREELRARAEIAAELEMRAAGATDDEIADMPSIVIGSLGPVSEINPWKRIIKQGSFDGLPQASRLALMTLVDETEEQRATIAEAEIDAEIEAEIEAEIAENARRASQQVFVDPDPYGPKPVRPGQGVGADSLPVRAPGPGALTPVVQGSLLGDSIDGSTLPAEHDRRAPARKQRDQTKAAGKSKLRQRRDLLIGQPRDELAAFQGRAIAAGGGA